MCLQGFLESWIGRGLFYILCSVWLYITTMHVDITIVDEHMEVETSETHSSMFDLHEAYISSSLYELIRLCIFCLLWICGCLYICMSCLCVNYFKKAQISKVMFTVFDNYGIFVMSIMMMTLYM